MTYSEMVMTGTLLKAQCSEWALVRRHPSEKLFGLQLATSKPEEAKKVTELVRREMVVDFVDLNAGCPIDVLERMGAGASRCSARQAEARAGVDAGRGGDAAGAVQAADGRQGEHAGEADPRLPGAARAARQPG